MKRFHSAFLFLFVMVLISCKTDDKQYKISGLVNNLSSEDPQVILAHFNPITQETIPVDTVGVDAKGYFEITYDLEEPDLFSISFPGRQSQILAINKGQNKIHIEAEGKRNGKIKIDGSEDSQNLLAYDSFRSESNERLIKPAYAKMREAGKAGNIENEVQAVLEYVQNSKIHRKELIDFTEKHIGNSIALYGTVLRWTGDDEVDRLEKLVNEFASEYPSLEMTSQMQQKVKRYKKVAIGAKAPEILAKNEMGETVNLNKYLGKYTLIDFWASWCGPCISQLPDLHQAYEDFHSVGFEIVSVSVDRNEKKWLEAIEEYNLLWKHISDVKGWQSELAKEYNVTFVPFNFLLDENGTIIAKNLHSKVLQTTLADLFGKAAS